MFKNIFYRQKIEYKLEYYTVVTVTNYCPPEHHKCCPGYIEMSGQCIGN